MLVVQRQIVHVAAQVADTRRTGGKTFPQRQPGRQIVEAQTVRAGIEGIAITGFLFLHRKFPSQMRQRRPINPHLSSSVGRMAARNCVQLTQGRR